VDDAGLVGALRPAAGLLHQIHGDRSREELHPGEARREGFPLQQLHHQERGALDEAEVGDRHHVVGGEAPAGLRLFLKPLYRPGLRDEPWQEDLDREAPPDERVLGLEDGAHAALPEQSDEAVAPAEERPVRRRGEGEHGRRRTKGCVEH
jgi:hypothetical protein